MIKPELASKETEQEKKLLRELEKREKAYLSGGPVYTTDEVRASVERILGRG